jgi:hypothetical protein
MGSIKVDLCRPSLPNDTEEEFDFSICFACIDYIKIFDLANRNMLWQIMKLKGFSRHLVTLIQSLVIENGGSISKRNIFMNQAVQFIILNLYSDHDERE